MGGGGGPPEVRTRGSPWGRGLAEPLTSAESEPEIDARAGVAAGEGGWAQFGEPVEPCRLVTSGGPPEQGCFPGLARVWGVADVGEFGVDGAQARVRELVLEVPPEALVDFGVEFLDGSHAAGAL